MIMVAGGNNYLLDSSQVNGTQGCITTRTHVLWELIVLAAVTVLIASFLVLYWIGMAIRPKAMSSKVKAEDAE